LSHDKYLRAPTFAGRSEKKSFLFLVDHIKAHVTVDGQASFLGKDGGANKDYSPSYPNLYYECLQTHEGSLLNNSIRHYSLLVGSQLGRSEDSLAQLNKVVEIKR